MRLSAWFSPLADCLTLSSFVEAIFLDSWERDGRLAKDSNPPKRRLQFDRHMLITGAGLDQIPASAESDSRSPHAVSGGAAEQILARDNGRLAIKIEGRLPIGMAREYGRVLSGVAEHQQRLVVGVNYIPIQRVVLMG